MKKRHSQIIVIVGLALFLGGMFLIYQIYLVTKAINSQPDPPIDVIIYNLPICNCDITSGLAWNIFAVLMSAGLILIVGGIAKYNLITRHA